MLATIDAASAQQTKLLLRLDELTALQEQALAAGDVLTLGELSEQRATAVRAAAGFVPPAMPWMPEVLELATDVKDRSDALQRSIRDCMAAVRKELLALNDRQRVSGYLRSEMAQRGAQWRR